jgi:hypothetical protein
MYKLHHEPTHTYGMRQYPACIPPRSLCNVCSHPGKQRTATSIRTYPQIHPKICTYMHACMSAVLVQHPVPNAHRIACQNWDRRWDSRRSVWLQLVFRSDNNGKKMKVKPLTTSRISAIAVRPNFSWFSLLSAKFRIAPNPLCGCPSNAHAYR